MTSHCLESCQDADVARPPLFNVDSVVANPQFIGSKPGSAMFPILFYAGLVVPSRLNILNLPSLFLISHCYVVDSYLLS